MTDGRPTDVEPIESALYSAINEVAKKYGYTLPYPSMLQINENLLCANLSLYKGDYKTWMRNLYIVICGKKELGLKEEWLDQPFSLSEVDGNARIIGADFEHETHYIRVVSDSGVEYLMSPIRIREIMEITPAVAQ